MVVSSNSNGLTLKCGTIDAALELFSAQAGRAMAAAPPTTMSCKNDRRLTPERGVPLPFFESFTGSLQSCLTADWDDQPWRALCRAGVLIQSSPLKERFI